MNLSLPLPLLLPLSLPRHLHLHLHLSLHRISCGELATSQSLRSTPSSDDW